MKKILMNTSVIFANYTEITDRVIGNEVLNSTLKELYVSSSREDKVPINAKVVQYWANWDGNNQIFFMIKVFFTDGTYSSIKITNKSVSDYNGKIVNDIFSDCTINNADDSDSGETVNLNCYVLFDNLQGVSEQNIVNSVPSTTINYIGELIKNPQIQDAIG